jgi:hypothetical protein
VLQAAERVADQDGRFVRRNDSGQAVYEAVQSEWFFAGGTPTQTSAVIGDDS